MHRRLLMLVLASLACASAATAQDSDRWMRLGQRVLDPRGERAVVPIARHPRLEALVLGVDNAAVRILDAKIELDNGRVITWPIRGVLYAGQRTHVLRLPGPFERRIKAVVLYYETGHSRRRPRGDRFSQLDRNLDRAEAALDPNREWRPRDAQGARDWQRDFGPDWGRDWNRDYDRDWGRNWDRDYGRLSPRVSVWGRD